MNRRFLRWGVGAKIALATSTALLFVAGLFLLLFVFLNIPFFSKFTFIHLIVTFVCLLVFVEILLVLLATTFFVGRPLQKLTDTMRVAEEGNFLVRAPMASPDELGLLADSFNGMLTKITDLDARTIETERELIMAQESLKYKSQLEEKALMIEVANHQLEASLKDLSILFNISQSLSRTLEFGELTQTVTRILTETLNLKEFSLLFFNETGEFLQIQTAYGFKDNDRIRGMQFKPGEGISGIAAESGQTIVIRDTKQDPRYLHYKGEKKEDGSFVSIPLIVAKKVIGVLNVSHSRKGAFSATEIQLLESVASQIAVTYDRSKLYMRVKELSVTDELTGIYNRRHFHQVLHMEWKRASRFSRPLSLLMVDMDYFKKYNDAFGHIQGDRALKNLAAFLVRHVREVDTVARFGGEEFVILLADTHFRDALQVGEKLREVVAKESPLPILEGGLGFPLTVSIGVSTFPEKAATEEDLLNTADIALYRAKTMGRNQVVGFEEDESQADQWSHPSQQITRQALS